MSTPKILLHWRTRQTLERFARQYTDADTRVRCRIMLLSADGCGTEKDCRRARPRSFDGQRDALTMESVWRGGPDRPAWKRDRMSELSAQISELSAHVAGMIAKADDSSLKNVKKFSEMLLHEANEEKPGRDILHVSGRGLIKAAQAITGIVALQSQKLLL